MPSVCVVGDTWLRAVVVVSWAEVVVGVVVPRVIVVGDT